MSTLPTREALLARLAQLDELETRRCGQDFAAFIKAAWHVLEPQQPLSWNWHLDLCCGELQDISNGRTTADLIINEPPGAMKSLMLVFWNAWEWGPRRHPELRYLCASHAQHLASRDNQRVRDLIQSEWYQARWPIVQLREDANQKTRFVTTAGGWRIGTSVGAQAAMGEHPHRKVIDDAHDPERVPGEIEREAVWHWFTQTMSQRGQALKAVTVVVGQRLHEDDLFGRILARLRGWTVVVLPQRYEPPRLEDGAAIARMVPTPCGRRDTRTVAGELLWPAHLTESVVRKSEDVLGGPTSEGVAAQHQQNPLRPGGNMFQRAWVRVLSALPADIVRWVRFWDVAGTPLDGSSAASQTAGVKIGETRTGRFVIGGDIVVGRWGDADVDRIIVETAVLDGPSVAIREEREGGSSGKAVVMQRARHAELRGYDYQGVRPTADKVSRARALRAQAEAGNVDLVARTDDERRRIEAFLVELTNFPRGRLKDQVDAAAGAFNALVELAGAKPAPLPVAPSAVENRPSPWAIGGGGGGSWGGPR